MNARDNTPCCLPVPLLFPVHDALHLVFGDTGCAACPWEKNAPAPKKRIVLSAHRDGTAGLTHGRRRLYRGLMDLIDGHHPAAAFVYATGIAEGLDDEVDAVCRKVEKEKRIPVVPVHGEGLKGKKEDEDRAACLALFRLMGTEDTDGISPVSVNILGGLEKDGTVGELTSRCRAHGVEVVSSLPGNSSADRIRRSHGAALNLVLSDGVLLHLAVMMEIEYNIPFVRVSGDAAQMAETAFSAVHSLLGGRGSPPAA